MKHLVVLHRCALKYLLVTVKLLRHLLKYWGRQILENNFAAKYTKVQ